MTIFNLEIIALNKIQMLRIQIISNINKIKFKYFQKLVNFANKWL